MYRLITHATLGRAVALGLFAATLTASLPGLAFAQPPPPPPLWGATVGIGLAVTSGNSDTTNFNLSFKGTHNPDNPHLATVDGLYLRGSNQGDLVINRSSFGIRDEYSLTERALLFGQVRYLRDTFKAIDYLVAPSFGVGYKILNEERTSLAVDAGVGVVWERDTGFDTTSSGSINLGQSLSHKLSSVATITESAAGLWKMSDFGDTLYTFGAGLTAAITTKSQLKIELLETYKSLPPLPTIDKQDVALITSLVYSF